MTDVKEPKHVDPRNKGKLGRPFGVKSKSYKMSVPTYTQRVSAVVTRRREKAGKKINDTGKLGFMQRLIDEDPDLAEIYKRAVSDVLSNPNLMLAKQIADVEVRIARHEKAMDKDDVKFLDPLVLKALELKMKAAKNVIDAMKALDRRPDGRGRRCMVNVTDSDDGSDVMDIDWEGVIDGKE